MADTAEQQPDPLTGSPPQKRKRSTESASPDARRSKRTADATAAAAAAVNTLNHGLNQGLEQAATAFMEVSGTGAPGGSDGDDGSGLTSPEFTAAAAGGGGNDVGGVGSSSGTPGLNVGTSGASDAETSAALASSTAQAALGSMYPTLHVPQSTEETFANQHVPGGEDDGVVGDTSSYSAADVSNASAAAAAAAAAVAAAASQQHHGGLEGLSRLDDDISNGLLQKRPVSGIQVKPAVGTDEWHKMRKDNHKEVERRRRETINEGINELAKIVPGCEKNKGSILQRAVVFITQLKENETQNIEKWTLEKLLTEQAIAELSASNDKLKAEVERLYRELETWKRVAQNAGLQPPEDGKTGDPPS